MCGRYTLSSPEDIVAEVFELSERRKLPPRYNIAPTQNVPVVMAADAGRVLRMMHWGLIPSWAKAPAIGSRMINARAETLAEKPSFRTAFKRRRCLVVADGFYEWKKLDRGKQPYYIRLADASPFAFAGLWEHWEGADGAAVDSCTIITTQPNELMAALHDRMPVILPQGDHAVWIDPAHGSDDTIMALLRPYHAAAMTAYPVSPLVNSPRNDAAECVRPLA